MKWCVAYNLCDVKNTIRQNHKRTVEHIDAAKQIMGKTREQLVRQCFEKFALSYGTTWSVLHMLHAY